MLGVSQSQTIPLPKGWARRVRTIGIADELTGIDSHARCRTEHQFLRIPRRDQEHYRGFTKVS